MAVAVVLVLVSAPLWLPMPGELLVDADPPPSQPLDAALVMEGMGPDAMLGAERWRQEGLVRSVIIVEAPVKTHALVAYWTDFVAWGLARPSPTPPEHLRVVRARSTAPFYQAEAALPALRELGATSVLVPGGGLGSRIQRRELGRVFGPAGLTFHLVPFNPASRSPGLWYTDADDRRFVLAFWVQMVLPASRASEAP